MWKGLRVTRSDKLRPSQATMTCPQLLGQCGIGGAEPFDLAMTRS
jgi:hypothetical protein